MRIACAIVVAVDESTDDDEEGWLLHVSLASGGAPHRHGTEGRCAS
jgi:hypothetical protein